MYKLKGIKVILYSEAEIPLQVESYHTHSIYRSKLCMCDLSYKFNTCIKQKIVLIYLAYLILLYLILKVLNDDVSIILQIT